MVLPKLKDVLEEKITDKIDEFIEKLLSDPDFIGMIAHESVGSDYEKYTRIKMNRQITQAQQRLFEAKVGEVEAEARLRPLSLFMSSSSFTPAPSVLPRRV